MELAKARLGADITRKFLGDDISQKALKKSAAYRFPAIECKSFIEIDGGEIVTEEEHADMVEIIKLMTEAMQLIAKSI